jgi:hypothetical protein
LLTRHLKPSIKYTDLSEFAQGSVSSKKTYHNIFRTPALSPAFLLVFREAESLVCGHGSASLAFSKGLVQHSLAHAMQ